MTPSLSNTKLGLLVAWPTFWTGFPIKFAIVLLLLAGGLHPWEGTGLGFLILLSIPIDIWALGVCARTVFLERLRVDTPPGFGLSLWWKWAFFSAIYLPILYLLVGIVTSTAKAITASAIELVETHLIEIPVAEQISLELTLWGSVAAVVLLLLLLGWLAGLGALAKVHLRGTVQLDKSYGEIVRYWDLLRVPADQTLLLVAMIGVGVVCVFLFWGLLPVNTPHPHDEYEYTFVIKNEKPIKPTDVIKKTEQVLSRASLTIDELEKGEKQKGKGDGQAGGSAEKGKPIAVKNEKKPLPSAASTASSHNDEHAHEHSNGDHAH
ncbi:MAG: hypothetical protein GKS05_08845 [Nitrospirales bacterium]|nr:hypothetical protein [Nitrospirales bacterium]